MQNTEQKSISVFSHGSAWIKADFHLHTKADGEFDYNGEENSFITDYIDKLKENNIRVGVITNHNKFDFNEYKALKKKAFKDEIYLLPGIELSVKDGKSGIHTIIVFSDEWIYNQENKNYIQEFITDAFLRQNNFENENSCSNKDLEQTLNDLEQYHKDYFS